jgi:hypothetical protein
VRSAGAKCGSEWVTKGTAEAGSGAVDGSRLRFLVSAFTLNDFGSLRPISRGLPFDLNHVRVPWASIGMQQGTAVEATRPYGGL